jgi:hypothetical protein
MNFGNFGFTEVLMMLLVYALPFVLAVWFIRTFTGMATAQREIAERLAGIEQHLQRIAEQSPV